MLQSQGGHPIGKALVVSIEAISPAFNREGAQVWIQFGVALELFWFQFGLGLDLNWVTVNMLSLFRLSCEDLVLESFWSQFGFRLVSIWFWLCFGFGLDRCTPLIYIPKHEYTIHT